MRLLFDAVQISQESALISANASNDPMFDSLSRRPVVSAANERRKF